MITTYKHVWYICLMLVILTFLLYWRTFTFNFTYYDDCDYVIDSPVTNGLTVANIRYAFTSEAALKVTNYHPITLISLMSDVWIAGGWKAPRGVEDPHVASIMHIHNAGLHALNAGFVFIFLYILAFFLQKPAQEHDLHPLKSAAVIAALSTAFWAWHPLRVESVAWISQRKDVLSLFFLLIGIISYLYARLSARGWPLIIVYSCYILAFLAKPTAIVYPLLLMLLDYLFLHRILWRGNEGMLFLMFIFGAVTFLIQSLGGATETMHIPISIRLENAVAAVGSYMRTTFYPFALSPMNIYKYPIPSERFWWGFFCVFCMLYFLFHWGVPCFFSSRQKQAQDDFVKGFAIKPVMLSIVGLLWFGIALGPVIGLVHVGYASHADRYTYLSGIGLSMIGVVILQKGVESHRARIVMIVLSLFLLGGACFLSYKQMSCWRNQFVFFEHVLKLDKANYVAANSHCVSLVKAGKTGEALVCIVDGLRYFYDSTEHRGVVSDAGNQMVTHLIVVFAANEKQSVEFLLGGAKINHDVIPETIVKDDDPEAVYKFYAQALYAYNKKLYSLAEQRFRDVLRVSPQDPMAWRFLGYTLEYNADYTGAINAYEKSLFIEMNHIILKHVQILKKEHP